MSFIDSNSQHFESRLPGIFLFGVGYKNFKKF